MYVLRISICIEGRLHGKNFFKSFLPSKDKSIACTGDIEQKSLLIVFWWVYHQSNKEKRRVLVERNSNTLDQRAEQQCLNLKVRSIYSVTTMPTYITE